MRKFALATVFALVGASGAFARSYSGDYTISFFIDPGATPGAQFCLELTPAPGIGGITNSGNFVDTDGFGISGQYLLDGKSFHLVMLGTPADDNIDAIGRPKGKSVDGAFDDFFSAYSPRVTDGELAAQVAGAGTFTLTPGCTDAAHRNHAKHHMTSY
jgi:hypothetical protein